ncbi:MAG: P1 family peptidase [Chloroflexi bacterium]|nr:P1 family peptidase [Chloroflexota bacterium]
MVPDGSLTDIRGLRVGHWTDPVGMTGCTVILCDERAVAGGAVRGGGPATHETDLLRPGRLVDRVDAILLTGGSVFGLAAVAGVVRWLSAHDRGYDVGITRVPIVPAAGLFDLALGSPLARPGEAAGYAACEAAELRVPEGSVGAGTGATVGKLFGMGHAVKGGIGTAAMALGEEVHVGALAVVNAFGDIVEPATGRIIAGARRDGRYCNTASTLLEQPSLARARGWRQPTNTTLVVVATNARLTREQAAWLAEVAHDGLALAVRPVHTPLDGDTVFTLATGQAAEPADLLTLGLAAVEVVARSIVRAMIQAEGRGGVPAASELPS